MVKQCPIVFPDTLGDKQLVTRIDGPRQVVIVDDRQLLQVEADKQSLFICDMNSFRWNKLCNALLQYLATANNKLCWGLISYEEQTSIYTFISEDPKFKTRLFTNPNTTNQMMLFTLEPQK